MSQFNGSTSNLLDNGVLESKFGKITQIDGFAIGASASPGNYFSFVKRLFSYSPETILPRLKSCTNSIAQFTYLLCQYRFYPKQEILVPWNLLRDNTMVDFQPFGCGKKETPLCVIVWLHLENMNYLGLFNDIAKPKINPTFNTMIFAKLPLYPLIHMKEIAFDLLISDPSAQMKSNLINWLNMQDDVYGYLEHEPETLIQTWRAPPLNLTNEKIKIIIEIFIKSHPNPQIFNSSISNLPF